VFIDNGSAGRFPGYLKERFGGRKCVLVTNTTVAGLYPYYIDALRGALGCAVHELPDGEKYKTVEHWSAVLDTFVAARLDRKSYAVAFGGGVVGDMAGFAAACFMRGIDYVQLPTTLLAMVDSSVGGKTAVDHALGKNLIGAFHQPSAVWIDTGFLETLPRRQFLAGCAEAFKYGFIGGREMFSFVAENMGAVARAEAGPLAECVERCIRVKADVVRRDEREAGCRAHLNFGHTFAHALERFYGFEGVEHGEAVMWGMACAAELGKIAKTLPAQYWADFDAILSRLPIPPLPSEPAAGEVYEAMFADKKAEAGALRFVLPVSRGEAGVVDGIGKGDVMEALGKVLRGWAAR
jgi:3-dehydroquinate synthase